MSTIFELSDRAVELLADADPMMATTIGVVGRDHRWTDLSPAGHGTRRALVDDLLREAHATETATPDEELAKRVLVDDLETEVSAHEAGDHLRDLNNIASAFQRIKSTIDLMGRTDRDDWTRIIVRLERIADPISGYRDSLAGGLAAGMAVARRQVLAAIEEGRLTAGDQSALLDLLSDYDDAGIDDDGMRDRLAAAIDTARTSYGELTDWLESSYLPRAREADAVGSERYLVEARKHLGMTIDIAETYAWGWAEIARLWSRLEDVCARIDPSAPVHDVVHTLATDPEHAALSVEEFIETMKRVQQDALDRLSGTHFDVPPDVRRIDVKESPPGGALSPYYTPPSEDFSRPGTVWYPVGDRTMFPLWSEITTAYHEGFPGHHLQVGVQTTLADTLSRYHRMVVWNPGSGEGWALYAEHLMDELGFLDEPAHVAGLLAAQLLRSCRIVIDIGTHCELAIPDDAAFHPGEQWSFDLAVEMMERVALQPPAMARSEVTRYFGWPGQAISYKIGERVILDLREQLRRQPDFDLKSFHTRVLRVGSVGLDLLRELVLTD